MEKKLFDLACMIASKAHAGQVDKAGQAYIYHPLTVASMVTGDIAKTVAVLHDVIEDTAITLQELSSYGFPTEVIAAIDCLTKRPNESRLEYINRIKGNLLAVTVKLADLVHNSDLSRISNPTEKDYARVKQYCNEIKVLQYEIDLR